MCTLLSFSHVSLHAMYGFCFVVSIQPKFKQATSKDRSKKQLNSQTPCWSQVGLATFKNRDDTEILN